MDAREKTYRKAFVPNALVYKVAQVKISKDDRILDIGCGVDEYHPKRLRSHGYTCDGIDLSRPDLTARGKYDVILLSNVLNVQTNIKDLEDTLNLLMQYVNVGTTIIWNYPNTPRKMDITDDSMKAYVLDRIWQGDYGHYHERLGGSWRGVYVTTVV